MTGANRLLIGVGWTLVVFLAWRQCKKRGNPQEGKQIQLDRSHAVELSYLALATAVLAVHRAAPLDHARRRRRSSSALFIAYTIRISRAPAEEPHLVGPAKWLGTFSTAKRQIDGHRPVRVRRRASSCWCAEHFAEALVGSGQSLGVSEFLLVQWLAPLASEAPELLVAGLYAMRLNTNSGLGTLVSSKVNQWTLLVGTLPIAFAIASGSNHGLPIDGHQREELFLTAAQSAFAVAVLINLSMSTREAQADVRTVHHAVRRHRRRARAHPRRGPHRHGVHLSRCSPRASCGANAPRIRPLAPRRIPHQLRGTRAQ